MITIKEEIEQVILDMRIDLEEGNCFMPDDEEVTE
jgi:hypothetical protein